MDYFDEALNEFKKRKILVIGDIFLDRFTYGVIQRINPEQPAAPLTKIFKEDFVIGGAANVANNIVSLSGNCCLYGLIGNDIFGEKLSNLCEEKKIFLKKFYSKTPTIVKQRVMAYGQQIARLDHGEDKLEKIDKETKQNILEDLKKEIQKYDFIILSDYAKNMFDKEVSLEIIKLSNSKNIPILVDPKPQNIEFFKGCTIVSPNKYEAEKITGMIYQNGEAHLKKMSEIIAEKVDSKYVVITCGKDGIFVYDKLKEKYLFVGTKAKEVANVTGAGDTFAATLALGMASNLDIFDSAALANYSAGVVVEKIGTSTPSIDEIKNKIKDDENL